MDKNPASNTPRSTIPTVPTVPTVLGTSAQALNARIDLLSATLETSTAALQALIDRMTAALGGNK